MRLQYVSTFAVERIENGFLVRHLERARAAYVHYEFEVGRQVERFAYDDAVERLRSVNEEAAEHAAIAAAGAPMQQIEEG